MNALLELFNFSAESYGENLSEGVLVFFIGIATVFSVLAIILAVLSLFGVVFGKTASSKKEKAAPAPAAVATTSATVPSDAEIIAVIAAAIAAAESECAGSKFRVVSFKRK